MFELCLKLEQLSNEKIKDIERKLLDKVYCIEQTLQRKAENDLLEKIDGRLRKIEDSPAVIEGIQLRLEHKVDQLRNNMDEPVALAVQGVIQEDKAEELEIEHRKKNVIVHGVSESGAEEAEERVSDDLAVLAAMFQEVKVDGIQVESVVRLGRKASDPIQNPRPMKLVLNSEENKINLLKNAKKPAGEAGRRVVKSFHTSGLDTQAARGEETVGSGIKGKESQRRKGFDNISRENCKEERLLIKSDDLVCFYINARNLLNKFDQFEAWIHDLNPDVIGVTETWATPLVADSEIALAGYDMFRQDRPVNREGGGVLLYVRNSLHAVQCELSARFPEQAWCYFLDANKHKCYLGICYRTPTYNIYGSHNHDLVKDLVTELRSTKKHFVLMGDFNYRFHTWPPSNADNAITKEAAEFYDCLEENFFTQYVEECTRKDAILDLVIADEPDVVHDVNDIGTFPGSDHQALLWKIQVQTTRESISREIFDYKNADMEAIKRELQSVAWDDLFSGLSTEQC